jgi:hypothetical protein
MKKSLLLLLLLFYTCQSKAQQPLTPTPYYMRLNIGFGSGIDYGGFGARITIPATPCLAIFGAAGYNLLELGANGGIIFRVLPGARICPFGGIMYGYNAVIKIDGADQLSKTYYGPSGTIGLEIWSRRRPSFFSTGLILPVRSSEFQNDVIALQNNPGIVFRNKTSPVGISVGYHFVF